ncbi:DUF58 domain-containing protein [Clostridium sp. YIM B02515]|uniref:DUF58 domain-containing protein n=1 Tax=Clostridium rhizosphaerae TaxID=2803861 RepID=A0ABS1TGG6_9CLOT|nr:DUF58 domain-containing protein [Clostridium rhizosphaerae]MBL4937701.1 DUF58 domain-containing protein [Clostridium rhizosphaerae]
MEEKNKLFDAEFFKILQNLNINIKKSASFGASGARKSKVKGTSVEFSDFREYVPGDDFRRIDWNAYGRFDKFFIKLFMEEREAMINVFVDSSKSMGFGEPSKSTLALRLAAAFSYLALNNLDRVCVNTMKNKELKATDALSGKLMLQRTLSYLNNIEFEGTTDINVSVMKKDFKSKGVSIIISDFFTENGIVEAVKYLTFKKQEVILIHILSPEELEPDYYGQVKLIDSETREDRNIILNNSIMKAYKKQLGLFKKSIIDTAAKYGAAYIEAASDEGIEKIMFEKLSRSGVLSSN